MTASPHRLQAPVPYVDIRRSYHIFRAAGGALVALVALWGGGASPSPWPALAAAFMVTDAITRIGRGTWAVPPLIVDTTVLGSVILFAGHSPAIASFIYVMTASMLLLPLRQAAGVVAYAMAWAPAVLGWSPLTPAASGSGGLQSALVLVPTALIAQLLYGAGRALFDAGERHRSALDSERKAVRLKDEFVSMVSHELRTPLTSIAGFTDTLRDDWAHLDSGEIAEFLHIVRRETSHLADLVEDVLVIPRLEAGKLRLEPQPIDVRSHAYDVARIVFQGYATEYSVAVPGGVVVEADPLRLRQILRNLLENARKYGGDQVLVSGELAGNRYRIMVSDNGPGVPEADRARIFDDFEQASKGDARAHPGVGLGLPIARRLARAMGGDLWHEPRFPTGAIFSVTVKLADRNDQAIVPGGSSQKGSSSSPGSRSAQGTRS